MKTLTSVSALLFRAIALAPALAIESPRPPDNGNLPDCPLAGPSFPTPSHLSNSTVFSNAIKNLNTQIADESLGLNSNTTAWAVAVFSAKENKTLFERYHMPGDIDVGVNRVDKNSIFRIGSVSKVFTVWAFLATLGDSRFNDPITKYIPELANASSPAHDGAIYDDIESARWEDVTVGDLASHSAGIARDGK